MHLPSAWRSWRAPHLTGKKGLYVAWPLRSHIRRMYEASGACMSRKLACPVQYLVLACLHNFGMLAALATTVCRKAAAWEVGGGACTGTGGAAARRLVVAERHGSWLAAELQPQTAAGERRAAGMHELQVGWGASATQEPRQLTGMLIAVLAPQAFAVLTSAPVSVQGAKKRLRAAWREAEEG